MSEPVIVLVDPAEPGNVGTAARAMKNFGFTRLLLVDPPPLDPSGEAYGFAGRAREDILPAAQATTLEDVASQYFTVGFTATTHADGRRHVRYPFLTPETLATELAAMDAQAALVFGREHTGLSNEELASLDRVCSIPATEAYPTLNLGQAVTVALYALQGLTDAPTQQVDPTHDRADEEAIDRFYEQMARYLVAINHPIEKRDKTMRLVRRVIGRAHPTEREIATLTGIVRRGAEFAQPPVDGRGD